MSVKLVANENFNKEEMKLIAIFRKIQDRHEQDKLINMFEQLVDVKRVTVLNKNEEELLLTFREIIDTREELKLIGRIERMVEEKNIQHYMSPSIRCL